MQQILDWLLTDANPVAISALALSAWCAVRASRLGERLSKIEDLRDHSQLRAFAGEQFRCVQTLIGRIDSCLEEIDRQPQHIRERIEAQVLALQELSDSLEELELHGLQKLEESSDIFERTSSMRYFKKDVLRRVSNNEQLADTLIDQVREVIDEGSGFQIRPDELPVG